MRLVLDSNEYIFSFGTDIKPQPRLLIKKILENFPSHTVRLPRLVVDEVRRNLSPESFSNFIAFIMGLTEVNEDFEVPFETGVKYEIYGLKPADAFIAAYVEWVGADLLVSENRHFLRRTTNLPFSVVNAEECLRLMNLPKG